MGNSISPPCGSLSDTSIYHKRKKAYKKTCTPFKNISKCREDSVIPPTPRPRCHSQIQGTYFRSVERCDSAYFYYQAWVPPLSSLVRHSGKCLFLALHTKPSYDFVAYVNNITEKKAFVNTFFNLFLPKCFIFSSAIKKGRQKPPFLILLDNIS